MQIQCRALFVLCGAQTLNLVVSDTAKSSPDANGIFHCFLPLPTGGPFKKRKKPVDTTLKSWVDTRWEHQFNGVAAVRFQAAKVRDAFLEVRDNTANPAMKVQA